MESGNNHNNNHSWRVEKRSYVGGDEDAAAAAILVSKKPKLPALASVIVDVLKQDSLHRLGSTLEPLLRKIVSEEIERALSKLGHASLAGRLSSPLRIDAPPERRNLQLQFRTRMPPHLFTGGKVEGEQGSVIHIVLLNQTTGSIVQAGPESVSKLKVTVLEGDFSEEDDDNWTKEHFESHEVKERDGKSPLLTGDLNVILKDGVGTLGDLTFTDNSSWIRSRKFRLGVKVAAGYSDEIRVREAKTEAFAVKDHRGELYKKHYPPALNDEVWRLDRIAKDGALHKKLMKAEVTTVEDFLRVLVREPQRLRHILGSGMSNRMWDNTVEHAKTCVLDGKLHVYYDEGTHSTGVVFNHIYELIGLISVGQFVPLESLTHNQKISVDALMKKAYENWNQVMEYDGKVLNSIINYSKQPGVSAASTSIAERNPVDAHNFATVQNRQLYTPELNSQVRTGNNHHHNVVPHLIEFPFIRPDPMAEGAYSGNNDFQPEEPSYISNTWSRPKNGHGYDDLFSDDIRLRSSEMLETDDMQRLLKTFGVNIGFDQSDEASYSQNVSYKSQMDREHGYERGRTSGKAVVGWLKLKAALRWGIFVRKRAAQRRAQLVELDD